MEGSTKKQKLVECGSLKICVYIYIYIYRNKFYKKEKVRVIGAGQNKQEIKKTKTEGNCWFERGEIKRNQENKNRRKLLICRWKKQKKIEIEIDKYNTTQHIT